MIKGAVFACAIGVACPVLADTQSVSSFRLSGDTLIFDTESGESKNELLSKHVSEIKSLLRSNSNVTTLELNSGGGSVWAGDEIARIVLDFELDTVVQGRCDSSCVTVFLAGENRSMTRGSKIGFHQNFWRPTSIKGYYEDEKENEGWEDPFEFASWVYEDTQTEIYQSMIYATSRGVTASFAIEMRAPRTEMWYPTRRQLIAGGVLTE